MGIRDIVNTVPAKPIIALALCITVLAAGWYGLTLHRQCTERAELTASLKDWADATLASGNPERLDQAVAFDWDEVRISTSPSSSPHAPDCPFGWHWTNAQRDSLSSSGNLTLVGFFENGKLKEVADFDSRWARFDVSDDGIPRDKAVFARSSTGNALQLFR